MKCRWVREFDFMMTFLRSRLSWGNHADLDVPKLNLRPVILQADVALRQRAKRRPRSKLALGDACLPVVAPAFILDDFGAVEPLLDAIAVADDAKRAPLA